ncbi:DUF4890 domain-containing protein [Pedobacter nutrimenti]|uniref:DUF4890 domain-containing protein n=1 Tax=Pedobacter nutrimenti TaxID=1241337 RepID=UPI0029306DB2|nr:DUF4890 domain-containing protein [Pedobacter nutrimenti]
MKKLLMIFCLLFSVITFANAQGGRKMADPAERAKKSTDRLAEKLSLNDDQKTKVLAIYTDQATQMNKAWEDSKEDKGAMKTKVAGIMSDSDAKITALLTDDQKKAYDALKAERKAAMEKRRGNGDNGGGSQ